MRNFQKALEQTEEHKKKGLPHNSSFKSRRVLGNHGRGERIAKNRRWVLSLIKTLMLYGWQNMPICGQRDSLKDVESNPDANHRGNFWALLHFRIDARDTELEEHLVTDARNTTYTSPGIQNQIVRILGGHIRDQILGKVKQAKVFTSIADEVTDAANKEQLSLVLG